MAQGQDYLTVATYEVKIDNVSAGNFVRVSGIGMDIEDIPAKNDNGTQIVNTPGSSNARDLTLTRRFSGDKSLYKWLEEVKTKGNQAKMRTGSIRLLNNEQKQVAQFDFDGAWMKSWQGPELTKDSHGNSILTETVVLSVGDLKYV